VTNIQRAFAPLKKHLPAQIYNPVRSLGTAILGPILFGLRTGYFRSSFKRAAVSKNGEPLPWYTYPSVDFLRHRKFDGKVILEFGGGQSSYWWAQRAEHVITLEGKKDWFEKLKGHLPVNVDLHYVSMASREVMASQVNDILETQGYSTYDVIVLDGLYRKELIPMALQRVAKDGMIICDNAEGYGFYDGFKDTTLNRVDFFGNAPGVVLPHCTSIYFNSSCFAFSPKYPIPVLATEK
jgi:hypothetical protein